MYHLRNYRILLVFYSLGFVVALWEWTSPEPDADRVPAGYPEVMAALYPDHPDTLYFRGVQAFYLQRDMQQARRYFEKALSNGLKTNENLLYLYAATLVRLQEDPQVIEAAVNNWRRNYPDSEMRDPRQLMAPVAAGVRQP